jgi:large subunit ribosomal protein L32
MPVPKRKRSRTRRDKRFANKGIQVKALTSCQNCKTPLMPHSACRSCGFYKGAKVMDVKNDRSVKRAQVRQAKQAAQKEQAPAADQE